MTQLSLVPEPDGSPFDKVRQHLGEHEWWSARDLMPLLGYEKWERFEDAIYRARTASQVLGHDTDQAFSRRREEVTGGRPREDYRLSRFACYLIAMNGDPRKHQIAAAMAYFAVKTREAEVAQAPRELTRREMAMAVIEAEDAREAAERALEAAQPAIEGYGQLVDSSGTLGLAEAGQALGMSRDKLIVVLHRMRLLIVRPGHSDHLRPYQDQVDAGRFEVKIGNYINPKTGERAASGTARITPKGLAYIQRRITEEKQR